MKWLLGILIVLLSFFTTLLDVAFFSNLEFYGATIILTFIIANLFSLGNKWEDLIVFISGALLFFAIFSSVPIPALIFVFYVVPLASYYLKKNYFSEPSPIFSVFYLAPAMLLFDLSLMIVTKQWSAEAILSLCYFVVINSIFGVIIYAPLIKIKNTYEY